MATYIFTINHYAFCIIWTSLSAIPLLLSQWSTSIIFITKNVSISINGLFYQSCTWYTLFRRSCCLIIQYILGTLYAGIPVKNTKNTFEKFKSSIQVQHLSNYDYSIGRMGVALTKLQKFECDPFLISIQNQINRRNYNIRN